MTRTERDETMERLSALLTEMWGERCEENEAGCIVCGVWAIYDVIDRLTDSELRLDDDDGWADR